MVLSPPTAMHSSIDILLLVLYANVASGSPVRRWLNTTTPTEATAPIGASSSAPINATALIEHAVHDSGRLTISDDCDEMSTATPAKPTWPAALSDIPGNPGAEPYGSDEEQAPDWPVQTHGEESISTFQYTTQRFPQHATPALASSIAAITSLGRHANSTASASPDGYVAAEPYGSTSIDQTTTLTLYTTVGPSADHLQSASSLVASTLSNNSRPASPISEHGPNTYGSFSTSLAAYTTLRSMSESFTTTPRQSGPYSSMPAYGSESISISSSAHPISTGTQSTAETTPSTEATATYHSSQIASHPASTIRTPSPSFAYPYPHHGPESSASSSASGSTVTVDPIATSYSAPSVSYSYSPRQSSNVPSDGTPAFSTSYIYSPQDSSSSRAPQPYLPTVVTDQPSSEATSTISISTTSTPAVLSPTTSSSSSSMSGLSTSSDQSEDTTSLGGITIVPVNPDLTTIYVTTTTTDAGMTTTIAEATITSYG